MDAPPPPPLLAFKQESEECDPLRTRAKIRGRIQSSSGGFTRQPLCSWTRDIPHWLWLEASDNYRRFEFLAPKGTAGRGGGSQVKEEFARETRLTEGLGVSQEDRLCGA